MNEKVLISITLPLTGNTYDVWIPTTIKLQEANALVANILDSKESTFFSKQNNQSFMLKSSGEILDASQTIGELDFKNGTQIVLV